MPAETKASIAVPKAPRHKKPLIARRRQGRKPEGEDDEVASAEEYLTEDSGLSDDDAWASDESEVDGEEEENANGGQNAAEVVNTAEAVNGNGNANAPKIGRTDTEVMRNGIGAKDDVEEVEFDDLAAEEDGGVDATAESRQVEIRGPPPSQPPSQPPATEESTSVSEERKPETHQERKRREVEEYKAKCESDPAFVPTRGKFFLHDQRDSGHGGSVSSGHRTAGRGRGRGGPKFGDFAQETPELAGPWKHDMHEQHEQDGQQERERSYPPRKPQRQPIDLATHSFSAGRQRGADQPRSFGSNTTIGVTSLQVNLPGMKAPIVIANKTLKTYTRLPYHRPPLRRDKAVRVALPGAIPSYIYPIASRSFIFIPRAMRPGGSGYIRSAGRGRAGWGNNQPGYHGGYQGGYQGNYQGGRSIYGGSAYTPSNGMSRRSSITFDARQHTPAQLYPPVPVPGMQTRPMANGNDEVGRPVVRLPSAAPSNQSAAPQDPPPQQQQLQSSAPAAAPQQPPPSYTPSNHPMPYRETRATPKIPMHQPRPQKAVNVSELDSPANVHFPQNYTNNYDPPPPLPPQGPHVNGYAHSRQTSYPSQASGTPLSQIPEAARPGPYQQPYPVHMQGPAYYPKPPHHPGGYPPPSQMYPQPMPAPHGYQPPPPQPPYVPAGPSPMPNGVTYVPVPAPPPPPPPPAAATAAPLATESNGMVYYSYPGQQSQQPQQQPEYGYPQSVVYPGTPGSMPITPAPDGSAVAYGAPAGAVPVPMYYYPPGYYPGP